MQSLINLLTLPFRWLLWIPLSVLSAPRRLLGMTLAMRVAVITAVFLVIATILVMAIKVYYHSQSPDWRHFLSLWLIVIPILWTVIPITLYYAIKLWLEGDVSNFPDIDLAWSKGLEALAQSGIDLNSYPIFLIVGVADDKHVRSLMNVANLTYRVKGVPDGPAALHWYATDQAIFLACTQVGRASKLANLAANVRNPEELPGELGQSRASYGGGTMVVGGGDKSKVIEREPAPAGRVASMTMVFGGGGAGDSQTVPGGAAPANLIRLSKEQEQLETARLEHLGHLLWRARQPVCPANGVLTVLPFRLLQRAAEGSQLRDAVKADLAAMRRKLKLRCPAVALVSGLESEPGFLELIRRVGPEPASVQRFGKSYNVHNRPTSEQLNAVGTHACGAFEDFVYAQFSKPDALRQVGNRKLYTLLCKIRAEIQPRLTGLLDSAFSDDADDSVPETEEAMLFGGCYFAATGDTEGKRAFVKSVFDKLTELENDVEWTQEAIDENDRYHRMAQIGLLADGLLLALVSVVVVWFWSRGR